MSHSDEEPDSLLSEGSDLVEQVNTGTLRNLYGPGTSHPLDGTDDGQPVLARNDSVMTQDEIQTFQQVRFPESWGEWEPVNSKPASKGLTYQAILKHMETIRDGPPFPDILEVALNSHRLERHLNDNSGRCFCHDGSLRVPWLYVLATRLTKERRAKKTSAEVMPKQKLQVLDLDLASQRMGDEQYIVPSHDRTTIIIGTPVLAPQPAKSINNSYRGGLSRSQPLSTSNRTNGSISSSPAKISKSTPNSSIRQAGVVLHNPQTNIRREDCWVCGKAPCECAAHKDSTNEDLRSIHCSNRACDKAVPRMRTIIPRVHSSDTGEIQEELVTSEIGFCPDCEQKTRGRSSLEHSNVATKAAPEIRPRLGEHHLDNQDICRALQELSGKFATYALTVRTQSSARALLPFLDTSSNSAEASNSPHILLIRNMLDIHDGITIKAQMESTYIKFDLSMWIKGMLAQLVQQFVFDSGSPFEDIATWRLSLSEASMSSRTIDSIIQDNRLRTIQDSNANSQYKKQRLIRRNAFVRRLNTTMYPFIGSDTDTNEMHTSIADTAIALNESLSAYTGTYEPIEARIKQPFDLIFHAIDDPTSEGPDFKPKDAEGRPLLMAVMFGVKFKGPGHDWIVCSPAKVRLGPKPENRGGIVVGADRAVGVSKKRKGDARLAILPPQKSQRISSGSQCTVLVEN